MATPVVKTRLVLALAGAGVPIDTVTLTGPAPGTGAVLTYMPAATPDHVTLAESIVAGFDYSPAADAEQAAIRAESAAAQNREAAKERLVSTEPMPTAARAGCYGLMLSLQEERGRSNAQTARINLIAGKLDELIVALGSPVAPLNAEPLVPLDTGDSLTDAIELLKYLIDARQV